MVRLANLVLFVVCLTRSLLAKKAWNTRFVFRANIGFSIDGTVTELCRSRDVSAAQVLGIDADKDLIRHVMSALVDKGDQQRFLEVMGLLGSKSSCSMSGRAGDDMGLIMTITSFVKGLKKVKRSVLQGRQLIDATSALDHLVSRNGLLLLVMVLNITLRLNMSGDESIIKEEDRKSLESLNDYSVALLDNCLQTVSFESLETLIAGFRVGILLHCPYDNLLRLRSSLLQRPRDQVAYSHALDGIGMMDAMVRDRRVEILTLILLKDMLSSKSSLTSQNVLAGTERVCTGELSHEMYREAWQLLNDLSSRNFMKEEEGIEEDVWLHSHYEEALEIVRGSPNTAAAGATPHRQLDGGDWLSCKQHYRPLLEGSLQSVARAQEDLSGLLSTVLEEETPSGCCDSNFASVGGSRVLVVGDGDLSFSSSLLKQNCCSPNSNGAITVTATVLESREDVEARYTGSKDNIAFLEAHRRGRVCFGVDATNLKHSLDLDSTHYDSHSHGPPFDTFIFNYPFADAGGTEDAAKQFSTRHVAVGRHQELLRRFLLSVRDICNVSKVSREQGGLDFAPTRVCISLLAHQALAWDLEQTASDAGFSLYQAYPFNEKLHRALGYKRRRSYSNDPFRQFTSGYATNVVEGWVFALTMDSDVE